MIELTDTQKVALIYLTRGENIFLTGAAGTGKSEIIKRFKKWCDLNKKKIAITSTTGVSALLIEGTTLHSWAGIGLGDDTAKKLTYKILSDKFKKDRWQNTDILIIDEVSMLNAYLFDKLEKIGRNVRGNNEPFGGLQLVLVGDFFQLPPVKCDIFCFESLNWDKCIDKIVDLTENMRQNDKIFMECLNEIRKGECSDRTEMILNELIVNKKKLKKLFGRNSEIKPTKLFAKKASVEYINLKELSKLENVISYQSIMKIVNKSPRKLTDKMEDYFKSRMNESCTAPDNLKLAVGAQVMLIMNLDVENGLVNGSRGVVIEVNDKYPTVKFLDGREINIMQTVWKLKIDESITVEKYQIPLILSYANTIHKIQGATIDYAIMDLGHDVFEDGQTYTALSRIKNRDGLFLLNFNKNKIKANEKVKRFYNNLIKK